MACAFGLPELVNYNAFIKDLEETGYLIDFVGGYLVFYGLPYLDKERPAPAWGLGQPRRSEWRRHRSAPKPPGVVAREQAL